MDKNWFEKLFIDQAKPALNRHSGGSGGMELNIAYGDTPPEDTSKLWVKTSDASAVVVTNDVGPVADYELVSLGTSVQDFREGAAYGVYEDMIYVFGGQTGMNSGATAMNTIACYDITANIYTTLPTTLPVNLTKAGVAISGSNIYVLGGKTDARSSKLNKNIFCFNAESQVVISLSTSLELGTNPSSNNVPNSNVARNSAASKSYIMYHPTGSSTSSWYCFDAETEEVDIIATDYNVRGFLGNLLYDGSRYIYVVGGYEGSTNTGRPTDRIRRIDTRNMTEEILEAKLLIPCYKTNCELVGNGLLVSGGSIITDTGAQTYDSTVSFVDLKNGNVTEISKDTVKAITGYTYDTVNFVGNTFVPVNSKLYILPCYATANRSSSGVVNDVIVFSPPMTVHVNEGALLMRSTTSRNTFPIINAEATRIEIGVQSVYKGNSGSIGEPVEAYLYKDGAWTLI